MDMQVQHSEPQQRSLGELFTELAHETGTLVRQEVELAKVEMTGKAKAAGKSALAIAGGGFVALLGALALMAALILGLGTLIPMWASALLVGLVVSIVGGVLVASGIRAIKGIDPAPRQTLQTLEEDKRWLKEQATR